jgi:hypothetical protein
MRKLAIIVVGLLVVGASAVAIAQEEGVTVLTFKTKVTPTNGGTVKKPQPHIINVRAHWETPGDVERPIVQRFLVQFPQGSVYNGKKYPKCSENVMARKGVKACPKGSIMGKGTGDAYADQVITHPIITVVNGGQDKVFFYTILNNPARVQAPVLGKITYLGKSGKYAYKMDVHVPDVLQVVAGVPIALRDLNVTAGSTTKDWVATNKCPGGHWTMSIETFYSTGGSAVHEDTLPCKK